MRIAFRAAGAAVTARAARTVAIDDAEVAFGLRPIVFVLLGDGEVLWRSDRMKERRIREPFTPVR